MNDEQGRFHKRSSRLPGYDYRKHGAYYVTVVTQQRYLHFDDAGIRAIAEKCWLEIPDHFPFVDLDEWILMPNHLHGVMLIEEKSGGEQSRGVQLNAPVPPAARNPQSKFSSMSPFAGSLAVLMRTYKAAVTTICRQHGFIEFGWQSRFYDHIIRDEADLNRIRRYIVDNPSKWDEDEENPKRTKK